MSGQFIQKRRESLGLSQRQFAELNNINFRTLQDYEQGRKPVESIKGDVLLKISKGLNCTIEDILIEDILIEDILIKDILIENTSPKANDYELNHLKSYNQLLTNINLYNNYYIFPVVVNDNKLDLSRVHPLKQSVISSINKNLSSDNNITSIMLFGSSISMKCNKDSDIDLAVRLKDNKISLDIKNKVSEKIQELCDWNADILWFDRLSKSERIYHDICKGVQIV